MLLKANNDPLEDSWLGEALDGLWDSSSKAGKNGWKKEIRRNSETCGLTVQTRDMCDCCVVVGWLAGWLAVANTFNNRQSFESQLEGQGFSSPRRQPSILLSFLPPPP